MSAEHSIHDGQPSNGCMHFSCSRCTYWLAYRERYERLTAADEAELAIVRPMSASATRARMRRMQVAGANPHAGREGGKAGYMRALSAGYNDEINLANMRLRECANKESHPPSLSEVG